MKKATLEDLLARKAGTKLVTKEVDVPAIGMSVTVVKQPLNAVARFLDEMKPGLTISQQLDIYKGLIYTCVPLFRDEKLQQAYEAAEPYDVIPAIFDDNILAIQSLGDEILGLYGFADMIKEVKNS